MMKKLLLGLTIAFVQLFAQAAVPLQTSCAVNTCTKYFQTAVTFTTSDNVSLSWSKSAGHENDSYTVQLYKFPPPAGPALPTFSDTLAAGVSTLTRKYNKAGKYYVLVKGCVGVTCTPSASSYDPINTGTEYPQGFILDIQLSTPSGGGVKP